MNLETLERAVRDAQADLDRIHDRIELKKTQRRDTTEDYARKQTALDQLEAALDARDAAKRSRPVE